MEIIDLEMIPGGPKKTCHASQFDNGRVIRFNLKENGQPFALSGTETVQAIIRKPDGSETTLDIANTESTYVDLITEADTCDIAGVNHCEMKVTEDGEDLGSGNFDMKVEEDAYGGGDVSVGTASGPIASFETDIKDELIECKGDISYRAAGYKQATFINSRSMPQKDTEPYLFRTSGGSLQNIGGQEHDTLVGGTVAFNQLIQNGNFASTSGWGVANGTLSINSNIATVTATANGNSALYRTDYDIPDNHVIVLTSTVKGISGKKFVISSVTNSQEFTATGDFQNIGYVEKATRYPSGYPRIVCKALETDDTFDVKYLNIFDVTQMFGSTIADYIYSLEQATAGAGVAFFKALFPNDYYAYNAGELMSVKATAHVMKNASNTVIGNYALDSNLELRGIPKLVNNKLEYDGDTYESTGAVSRKYGVIDLGSLNWEYDSVRLSMATTSQLTTAKRGAPSQIYNMICKKYVTDTSNHVETRQNNKTISLSGNRYLRVYDTDAGTDAATFKTAMSGVYLVYEKATPSAETADPFTNPQAVSKYGTEEYIDGRTVEMPVGHSTIYGDDIQEKTATFPERIYGGSINLTTGELTSTKNADGTDKETPDTYQLTPKNLEARSGQNNIMNDTNGDTAVKFYVRA